MQTIDQLVLDENNIAFHPMMGNSYQLNDTAHEIINFLKQHKSKEEIIELLVLKYELTKSEAFIDVSDFFTKMRVYGLLL